VAVVHDLVIEPQRRPLVGSVPVPADDAIAVLALVLAAVADGTSEVRRLSSGPDGAAAIEALRALGVGIDVGPKGTAVVKGVGLSGLAPTRAPVECGASSRTMRLLAAVLASRPFETVLRGDAALLATSMTRLLDALRRRGAVIEGSFFGSEPGEVTPPLVVGPLDPRRRLSGVEHELASPAADVKEALLLSGLWADESTYVRERILSPDHAERMLGALDVPIDVAGPIVRLEVERWAGHLPAFAEDVPGDLSASAILLAAATLVPGSRVSARGTGLNVTRRGALDWISHMGGVADIEVHRTVLGEPEGVASSGHAELRAVTMAGENLLRAGGELHVLAALAARARGTSEIADLASLFGAKGASLAIARLACVLRAFGVRSEPTDDGLVIEGRPEGPLRAADVDAEGEPGVAAAATLLGLTADGRTRVRGADALARRFPRFVGTLRALGVDARVEERSV
jgi:3-phosphoshikimate 1-carboxyvinyltransferase